MSATTGLCINFLFAGGGPSVDTSVKRCNGCAPTLVPAGSFLEMFVSRSLGMPAYL